MIPFVAVQIQALVESIRLLEAFVTAPLGLYSDIKMLRESLPFPEAAELSTAEIGERRLGLRGLTDDPPRMALDSISQTRTSLAILERSRGDEGPPLDPEWVAQARRVLDRAERSVAGEMRAKTAERIKGLYVIVDPEATNDRPVLDVAAAALRGGAEVIQLRDKKSDKGLVLSVARELKAVCDEHNALFIVNDYSDVTLSSEAHGLHVGQSDMPVGEARRVLAHTQLVGRSNNSVEEAMESQSQGADYLAVGAMYPTATMGKADRKAVGPEMVEKVKGMVDAPVVAIGGITADNIGEVTRAGADSVCVVSAVTQADDVEAAARRMVEAIHSAAG